jgi:hypothetical protein
VVDVITYQEALQERISLHFNQHIPLVLDYVAKARTLPQPLQVARDERGLAKWKSPARFQKLYREWRANRVAGDEEAFKIMERWAYEDLHLYEWARAQSSRWIRRRNNTHKVAADRICRTYSPIYLDSRPMVDKKERRGKRRMAKTPDDVRSTLRKWKRRASFAGFRSILKSTAARLGVPVYNLSEDEMKQAAE